MPERRWRVTVRSDRGLFLIEVDDGSGFRELFGAADYPARNLGRDARPAGSEPARSPAGRTR